MTKRGVRVWLLVALHLHLRCAVDALAFPHEGLQRHAKEGKPTTTTTMSAQEKFDRIFHLKETLQKPPSPPHKQAPQFMVDLFNSVSKSAGTPLCQKDILKGNIVRSFEDKGHTGERFHFFNLSSFSRDERMIKAEFRWFRQKQKHYFKSLGPHVYKVDVYEVLESRVRPWRGNLITTRLVPLYTQGWEVFNVTQTVSKWIGDRQENNGILVVTTLPSGAWLEAAADHQRTDRNAYLVVFSDDARTELTGNTSIHHGHGNAPPSNDHHDRKRRAIPAFLRGRPQPCQRVPLFVDFEEIGWAGWIISPRGYNANHCKGSCPFPLGESLRATNHATVQSIMHALKLSDDVGSPCCVPDKLQSISLLYFDDEENVVLKQYDDMVAVSCGCH
ncbi:bone morphogenetic protein 2-like isoform X1 [Gadus macrocephalus]|uniref:bone morphogenetic protein 2-like isoform X1 n=2 Tax=Gadus macrocephalus TaxID=80720 RepID=UPI0028CB632A|nr:bone morphogenetic protein 2-like isoform X1 [Gadus macrocephalus]